ncbi:MAG: M23 family metallopeptidase, partial [Chitinophagales bacterium]
MTRKLIEIIFEEKGKIFSLCLCFSAVFIFCGKANSQTPHFRNPLDIPIHLAANFGEIRADHYHTGYDIRTNEKTGLPVHAAADGYVSRIKVSPYGYGNALYITHANGYMTVYGHLDHFNDAIGKFVKEQQYAKQSYEVELFPDASKFPVKEGDIIAYSGNSGSSEGPHLHFEIRDAHGETYPLNPEKFLPVEDHEQPRFHSLWIYALDQCCNQDTAFEVFKVISTDS